MSLTTTGAIHGFGRVSLPTPPRRVSSKRYVVPLRAQLEESGDPVTIFAACDEHDAVVDIETEGKDKNLSFLVSIDTTRARDPHRYAYQVVDDLLRAIMRKTKVEVASVPDPKPALFKRPVGRIRH